MSGIAALGKSGALEKETRDEVCRCEGKNSQVYSDLPMVVFGEREHLFCIGCRVVAPARGPS